MKQQNVWTEKEGATDWAGQKRSENASLCHYYRYLTIKWLSLAHKRTIIWVLLVRIANWSLFVVLVFVVIFLPLFFVPLLPCLLFQCVSVCAFFLSLVSSLSSSCCARKMLIVISCSCESHKMLKLLFKLCLFKFVSGLRAFARTGILREITWLTTV